MKNNILTFEEFSSKKMNQYKAIFKDAISKQGEGVLLSNGTKATLENFLYCGYTQYLTSLKTSNERSLCKNI
jgi:hypothetical protein